MKVGKNYLGQNPWQAPPFVPPTMCHSLLPLPSWNTDWVIQPQYSSLLTSCLVSCNSSYCSPHIHVSLQLLFVQSPSCAFLSLAFWFPLSFVAFSYQFHNLLKNLFFYPFQSLWHVENYCLKSPSFKKIQLHEWTKDWLRTWHTNIPLEFQTGQCAKTDS